MEEEKKSLPPWDDDPLSEFMSHAEHNTRASAVNFPDMFEIQVGAIKMLRQIVDIIEKDPADKVGATRFLIARAHSEVLAAMRLAMGGQGLEAQPMLRGAIECAWYALHIAKDPAAPARAEIWWGRGEDDAATQACKNEFTVGNVRSTHEKLDAATADDMKKLYESPIEFGGHPNQAGIAGSLVLDKSTGTAAVGYLHPGSPMQLVALKGTVDAAVGVAKTCRLIYPERFEIAEVDQQIEQLTRHSAPVFQKYAKLVKSGALK